MKRIITTLLVVTICIICSFTVLSAAASELARQQLPWGRNQVASWMLGTPQPVGRELYDVGSLSPDAVGAGVGVGWEDFIHPENIDPPWGIPFEDTPWLNCLFADPDYTSHTGVDFPEPLDTPVLSTMAGKVVWAASNGDWGNLVVVENNGVQTYYAHLNEIHVVSGDVIGSQTQLGLVGSTGNSTGPHLHYGIKVKTESGGYSWRNPINYLPAGSYTKISCPP